MPFRKPVPQWNNSMKNTVASLLNQQVQCVVATLGDKELALHLMAYAISSELDEIYLASLENTQKVLLGQSAVTARRLLLERNATLQPLLSEPSAVIFALHIDRYQWVEGYTRVIIYEPENSTLG